MKVGNMEINCGTGTLGAIIAIIILVLVVVLAVIGRLPTLEALLIGGLALARLT